MTQQPSTIKEVRQARRLLVEAAYKHMCMTTLCQGMTRSIPGMKEAADEHVRLSNAYSAAIKRLPPGLVETIGEVTYETVQMSSPVFGDYVVIQTTGGERDHF